MHEEQLIAIIKKAAVEAVEAMRPTAVAFGRITALSPLTVRVDQKLTLSGNQLTVAGGTQKIGDWKPGLQAGDEVILLRMQGGQKYILLDKVVK